MKKVKVSVVVPVYNAAEYLEESLYCIENQTENNIEIICVNDSSTDNSLQILQAHAKKDKRIKVLNQNRGGAGAARNLGFSNASGKYAFFFDADDLCSLTLLEETVAKAEETQADIVGFDFLRFDTDGSEESRVGVHLDWLKEDKEIFNYADCPDRIMSIINPTPWNKLYRADFIRENNLKFEEISSSNDITFAAVSSAYASRIAYIKKEFVQYRIGHGNTITATKSKNLNNVITAVSSAVRQVKKLSYSDVIFKSICRFAIDNYIFALEHNIQDFSLKVSKEYYEYVHNYFNSDEFINLEMEDLGYYRLWVMFCSVKKHDYEEMLSLISRKVIISLTSFPERIKGVSYVVESLLNQTKKADKIILWLAEEQFPNKEDDLPDELRNYESEGKMEIEWCDDLKPHKKYFYTMQKYPDDIVILVDDDLIFNNSMIQKLYDSYLLYPDAVSAMRAHVVALSEDGTILPYKYWIKETDSLLFEPSMQYMATTGFGTLFPPKLLPDVTFDKEIIANTCPCADDLWLKTMEIVANVPTVVASKNEGWKYVPDSQENSLWKTNVDLGGNDNQLNDIINWMENYYGENLWSKKLRSPEIGRDLLSLSSLYILLDKKIQNCNSQKSEINKKLQRTYAEKSEINKKLQQAYADKSEINKKLQQSYADKSEINRRLQQAYAEKTEINKKLQQTYVEKSEINKKLQQTYAEKSEINKKLKNTYTEKSELNKKLKKAYKEKSEINEKLQQTYEEKAERGKEIEALNQMLQDEKTKLEKVTKEKENIENSTTFKIGRIIMWIPTHIKNFFKRTK